MTASRLGGFRGKQTDPMTSLSPLIQYGRLGRARFENILWNRLLLDKALRSMCHWIGVESHEVGVLK